MSYWRGVKFASLQRLFSNRMALRSQRPRPGVEPKRRQISVTVAVLELRGLRQPGSDSRESDPRVAERCVVRLSHCRR